MAGYLIASYRITNPDAYQAYPPAVMPTLMAHGAEVLVADYQSQPLEGEPPSVTVVIKFASKEAARAWYDSPEYRKIVGLRTDNSEGVVILADGFAMPR
jgi:uncharacterized protein (DUF1330 family)